MVKSLISLWLFGLSVPLCAHGEDTRQHAFDPDVRTVAFRNPDSFMSPALIRLGTPDRLNLNFDILGESHDYLRARLVHCNADWTRSRLLDSEFASGFNETEITDYAYSTNTFTHYVNYNLELPSPDLEPLTSGNYLLQVFREDDPDDVILQVRFAVSENSLPVSASVTTATDRGFNTQWQQVEIAADLNGQPDVNPFNDLKVSVVQNNTENSERFADVPLRVVGTEAVYEHNPKLVFPAGNEYRRFETVRADMPGMHADSVAFIDRRWHSFLSPDEPRNEKPYYYDRTQHGRFMVDETNATDPDIGADYVTVHFTLETEEMPGVDIHVDGDFAHSIPKETSLMNYDSSRGAYIAEIPLKQGSYNYRYVAVDSNGTPDPSPIEGNTFETRNEYLVKMFVRKPGSRADRLVGAALVE